MTQVDRTREHPATPSGHNVSGPWERSAFAGVTP
jgi:hypothetical protein